MPPKSPLVSIVITCYNYADFVSEAIEGALNQTYKNKEILVMNDGSTDRSKSVIEKYKGKVKIISRENKGIVYTRNEGLDKANGKYVLFLDADDRLADDYVMRVVTFIEKHNADVVYTDMQFFGEKSTRTDFPDFDIELLKTQNYIGPNTLFRKTAIGRQRFDPRLEKLTHEDWDFYLGLALKGVKIMKMSGPVYNYRVHKQGVSRNTNPDADKEKFTKMSNYIFTKYTAEYDDFLLNYKGFVQDRLKQLDAVRAENIHLHKVIKEQKTIIDSLNERVGFFARQASSLDERIAAMQRSYVSKAGTTFAASLGKIRQAIKKGSKLPPS